MTRLAESVDLGVSTRRAALNPGPEPAPIERLRNRIKTLERPRSGADAIPCYPGFSTLLPGGAMRRGAWYGVEGSASAAAALLAGPSAAGAWCAAVGAPGFGVEAAAQLGVNLDHLVLIPEPGQRWLQVTATLLDVMGGVLLAFPGNSDHTTTNLNQELSRLAARSRNRGCILIAQFPWSNPKTHYGLSHGFKAYADVIFSAAESRWTGITAGRGYLQQQQLLLRSQWRNGRARKSRVTLPDRGLTPVFSAAQVTSGTQVFSTVPGLEEVNQ